MAWKETTTMEQKVAFIQEWRSGLYTITELCRSFEISRPTAYRLIARFEEEGLEALLDRSRRPISHPNATDPKVVNALLKLKEKHPKWGAKKLQVLLFNDFPDAQVPSVVTLHNILRKHGLVQQQKRRRRVKPVHPIFDPQNCNEVWSADFKGKFRLGNKTYCHPLTITDSKSRFLFTSKGCFKENFISTKNEFTKVFRKFGIPEQIHTDNGVPFGNIRAIQRFTKLSYWFIDLGITPVFSDPAHPEQNGRHERMHRDLKAACTQPPAHNMTAQQRLMNRFVKEFNYVRPHEALDMKTPGSVHSFSTRPFPEKVQQYGYPDHMKVLKVTQNGSVRWKSYWWVYVSSAISGKHVAAEELDNGIWRLYYRNVFLGYFDENNIRNKDQIMRLSINLV